MKVSFVVPCFNEEKLIERCLRSILTEIARSRALAEIVVVDNGSTDRTIEIVDAMTNHRGLHPWVLRAVQPRKGIVWARQTGHDVSVGEIVCCVDADNVVPGEWLDHVLRAFEDPEVVAVSGPVEFLGLSKRTEKASKAFYKLAAISHRYVASMLQGGNYAYRRSALDKIGGYDTSVEFFGEDTRTAQLLSKVGKILYLPEMKVYSTDRRFVEQGLVKTTAKYVLNYIWVHLFGRPFSNNYVDLHHGA